MDSDLSRNFRDLRPIRLSVVARANACGYTLLNVAYYGVPQMRERLFLIGYRREIANGVTFPEPTHWVDLPPGYEGSRAVALKLLCGTDGPEEAFDYIPPPEASEHLPPAPTAVEAIGDLPPIDARAQLRSGVLERGARRFDRPVPWDLTRKVSGYARTMRMWPGFEAPGALLDHVIRYLPRDYELFARMNAGDQYPQAWRRRAVVRLGRTVDPGRGYGVRVAGLAGRGTDSPGKGA